MRPVRLCQLFVLVLACPVLAAAQSAQTRAAVEGMAGQAWFLDESAIRHTIAGGAFRFHVTPRISIGPEVTYMVGPGSDRDLFLLGDVWIDFLRPDAARSVSPYFVAGGGMMTHWPEFDFVGGPYREGAVSFGLGARINVSERWYVAPEGRIGWEPHTRLSVSFGYRLKP